jgi:hypothetical protein
MTIRKKLKVRVTKYRDMSKFENIFKNEEDMGVSKILLEDLQD